MILIPRLEAVAACAPEEVSRVVVSTSSISSTLHDPDRSAPSLVGFTIVRSAAIISGALISDPLKDVPSEITDSLR